MSDTPSETQSDRPDDSQPVKPVLTDTAYNIICITIFFAATGYLVYRMMQEDEVRLHALHKLTSLSQHLAKQIGILALLAEQAYNQQVESMR